MKIEDKRNVSVQLDEYDFRKLKLKFLDKDEIKIFSTNSQQNLEKVAINILSLLL